MKIYAIYNIKGGVGKTTSAVNLAYLSAAEGARTLLWDLDHQGSASYYLCVKPKIEGGAKELIEGRLNVNSLLRMTGYPNLDLFPSDISYRRMDQALEEEKDRPSRVVGKLLKPVAKHYDNLFLDCPPGLSLLAETIFGLCDVLLVPMIPTTLSLRAYNRLVRFLVDKGYNRRMRVLPFFTLVHPDKPIHRVVTANVREKHPVFLKTIIPDSNIIEAMGVKRSPIFTYARQTPDANSYRDLWAEIKERSG
ncbi:MAG: ParA family protein [Magnetococcales bacterium]|nr:ParA family protein [Magnetococcales bacterium]